MVNDFVFCALALRATPRSAAPASIFINDRRSVTQVSPAPSIRGPHGMLKIPVRYLQFKTSGEFGVSPFREQLPTSKEPDGARKLPRSRNNAYGCFGRWPTTSRLPPEADIVTTGRHVSKVQARSFPHYSITSSARASSVGGTVRPSALAILRLMVRSNLVGCSIGMSAGFAPRNILST